MKEGILGREEGLAVGGDEGREEGADPEDLEQEVIVCVHPVGIKRRTRQESLVLKKNALNAILI
jgi:hypothetical protein